MTLSHAVEILATGGDEMRVEKSRGTLKIGFLALVLSLGLVAKALAGPFEDGLIALQRADYNTALRLWQPMAERGSSPSRSPNTSA